MPPMPPVVLVLHVSHMLTVYAVGLRTTLHDGSYLFRRPLQLARIIVAMNVVMPALVLLTIHFVKLVPAVEIALLTLALSPVPALLLDRAHHAQCEPGYVVALLVSSCCLAPIVVPGGVALAALWFGRTAMLGPLDVLHEVSSGVVIPLAAAFATRRLAPRWAERAAKPLFTAATRLFVVGAVLVVLLGWRSVLALIGGGTWLAFALFVAIGLLIGHLFGGKGPRGTAVALAVASRHPGMALAIAAVYFPTQTSVAPALVTYVLVSELVAMPYTRWIKRRQMALTQGDGRTGTEPESPSDAQYRQYRGKYGEAEQTKHSDHLG